MFVTVLLLVQSLLQTFIYFFFSTKISLKTGKPRNIPLMTNKIFTKFPLKKMKGYKKPRKVSKATISSLLVRPQPFYTTSYQNIKIFTIMVLFECN